jgi:hypothetical protein
VGLVHIQRPIAIIIELIPNLLDDRVDDVVDIFIVFLVGRLILGSLNLSLLFGLQLVILLGDRHS